MSPKEMHAEKLDLIGWIYNIQDISIIEKLKSIQKNIVLENYEATLHPMSSEEMLTRAKEANLAIEKNDTISQTDLEKETQNW